VTRPDLAPSSDFSQASPILRGPEALDVAPYQPLWPQDQASQTRERIFGSSKPSAGDPLDVDLSGHLNDPRIAEFEGEVTRLRQQLVLQKQEAQAKLQEAIVASRLEAQRQFQRDDAARTQALVQAAKEALAQQALHLQRLESEAVRIASTALLPVFGEAVELSGLVLAMIEHQVSLLQERSVVELRLSAADDLDLEAVVTALQAHAQSEALVVADPALPRGGVRIGMRLGHVRLDLQDYAKAVRDTLREVSEAHWQNASKEGPPP